MLEREYGADDGSVSEPRAFEADGGAQVPPNNDGHDARALLAQSLAALLLKGYTAPQLRRIFSNAIIDAARILRNELGLTVAAACSRFGVRRNDLTSAGVTDDLDTVILRQAVSVAEHIERKGRRRVDGRAELTRQEIEAALDESNSGRWRTLRRTFHQSALPLVIDRLLEGDDVTECQNQIVVGKKSFFPAVKRQEALSDAQHSAREVFEALTCVIAEMRSDDYGTALRDGLRPRTEHASYSSLAIRWEGSARSFMDALRAFSFERNSIKPVADTLRIIITAHKEK
jgi:hypothetical protein